MLLVPFKSTAVFLLHLPCEISQRLDIKRIRLVMLINLKRILTRHLPGFQPYSCILLLNISTLQFPLLFVTKTSNLIMPSHELFLWTRHSFFLFVTMCKIFMTISYILTYFKRGRVGCKWVQFTANIYSIYSIKSHCMYIINKWWEILVKYLIKVLC